MTTRQALRDYLCTRPGETAKKIPWPVTKETLHAYLSHPVVGMKDPKTETRVFAFDALQDALPSQREYDALAGGAIPDGPRSYSSVHRIRGSDLSAVITTHNIVVLCSVYDAALLDDPDMQINHEKYRVTFSLDQLNLIFAQQGLPASSHRKKLAADSLRFSAPLRAYVSIFRMGRIEVKSVVCLAHAYLLLEFIMARITAALQRPGNLICVIHSTNTLVTRADLETPSDVTRRLLDEYLRVEYHKEPENLVHCGASTAGRSSARADFKNVAIQVPSAKEGATEDVTVTFGFSGGCSVTSVGGDSIATVARAHRRLLARLEAAARNIQCDIHVYSARNSGSAFEFAAADGGDSDYE